ncbi:FkbM family methyltransferase [Modestobacter sp. SYSU DS0657]
MHHRGRPGHPRAGPHPSATGPGAELEWAGRITVPLRTLDELVAVHGRPALVKIDVEGHEPGVVRGLTTALPTLFFEVNRPGVHDVLDTLTARRYTDFLLRRGERSEWLISRPMTAAEVHDQVRASSEDYDCLALSPEPGQRRPAAARRG